eukprot:TRINITY_DN19386_c1_g1_i1.p3 TRINITY_DN19386_c1_g1~~TRINITY_DN19386_c1_g1_i1.p3  ORF type:complete len:277 (+),score=53.55 TRINITY_DN19386_c1_g1_i1:1000-1830(+)
MAAFTGTLPRRLRRCIARAPPLRTCLADARLPSVAAGARAASAAAGGGAPAARGNWEEAQALARGRSLGGFEIEVRKSRIEDEASGRGVFVATTSCRVAAGSLVALYAGVWFPAVPLSARCQDGEPVLCWARLMDLHGPEAMDPELAGYSSSDVSAYHVCCDGGIMDGFRADERVRSDGINGPFAVAQLVNHPPRGLRPNVKFVQFEECTAPAVSRMHEGLWYLDPLTHQEVRIPRQLRPPTVALAALRDIDPGEELLLDYRLNPPHPPWYVPVGS